jgi:peroxin-19
MEQMMKELDGLMESGDFEKVFGGFMEQLMSKDVLYEPLKELSGQVS